MVTGAGMDIRHLFREKVTFKQAYVRILLLRPFWECLL
jgi:hypothetical protein